MTKKKIDEIVSSVQDEFRTFGGGRYSNLSNNPIAFALKDNPAQFAAGVDVRQVVMHILKISNKKSFTPKRQSQKQINQSWNRTIAHIAK